MSREYKHIGMKMKTQLRYLIILMALLAGFSFPVATWAQSDTQAERAEIVFDISKGNIVFGGTYNGSYGYDGYNSSGTRIHGAHNDNNIYVITGKVTSVSTPTYVDGVHGISDISNPYTVTIETVNLVPGSNNAGRKYQITLRNMTIDRSRVDDWHTWRYGHNEDPQTAAGSPNFAWAYQGLKSNLKADGTMPTWRTVQYCYSDATRRKLTRPAFDAGDDTIDVIITLEGNDTIKGETGPNAGLQYARYDGTNNTAAGGITYYGTLGTGSLTIKGTGSLYVKKDGQQNAGPAIGAPGLGADPNSAANGHLIFESGTVTASTGGPGDYSVPVGQHPSWGYDGMIGHPSQFGSYAPAIGGGIVGVAASSKSREEP